MPLKGPTSGLVRLSAELSRFGQSAVAAAGKAAADEMKALVALGFRASKAPDGTAWAPLKRRAGKPLEDTGRLKNSFTAEVKGRVVKVGTNVEYAPHHQHGTRKKDGTERMPARPMIPKAGEIPAPWRDAIDEAVTEAVARRLKKLPVP